MAVVVSSFPVASRYSETPSVHAASPVFLGSPVNTPLVTPTYGSPLAASLASDVNDTSLSVRVPAFHTVGPRRELRYGLRLKRNSS